MRLLKYFLLSILFFSSCDKFDWHNPYDPECPKELFTPSSPGATMEGNSVKLTWSQQNDDISGFALFRSAEGEPIANLTQTQKSATQYLDASVTPGKKYTYYVLAVAGTNKSDTIKAEITPVFPITISTGAVTELAATSAKVSGNITSAGGGTVTSRGICWSTTQNPTVSNSKTTEGTGFGQYISTLSGLLAATTYFARAYGENSRGIVYGSQINFTTLGPPTLTTTAVSNITATSATSGGTIISDGGSPITAKGIVWSTSPNPTIALSTKTDDGTGVGAFTSTLSNLSANTKYYIRAYATNIVGTTYGEEQTFLTLDPIVEKLKTGLVAYYPFNGNANDESGNGNNGSVKGAILSLDRLSIQNSAFSFNGISSYIDFGNSEILDPLSYDTFSISVWVKSNIIKPGAILSKYLNLFAANSSFLLNLVSNTNFLISGNGTNWVNNSISLNGWTHFYVEFRIRQSEVKYSINGGIMNTNIGRINYNTAQTTTPFYAGRVASADPGLELFFNGEIDDIRIYNRVLTQEEITYLANN